MELHRWLLRPAAPPRPLLPWPLLWPQAPSPPKRVSSHIWSCLGRPPGPSQPWGCQECWAAGSPGVAREEAAQQMAVSRLTATWRQGQTPRACPVFFKCSDQKVTGRQTAWRAGPEWLEGMNRQAGPLRHQGWGWRFPGQPLPWALGQKEPASAAQAGGGAQPSPSG